MKQLTKILSLDNEMLPTYYIPITSDQNTIISSLQSFCEIVIDETTIDKDIQLTIGNVAPAYPIGHYKNITIYITILEDFLLFAMPNAVPQFVLESNAIIEDDFLSLGMAGITKSKIKKVFNKIKAGRDRMILLSKIKQRHSVFIDVNGGLEEL